MFVVLAHVIDTQRHGIARQFQVVSFALGQFLENQASTLQLREARAAWRYAERAPKVAARTLSDAVDDHLLLPAPAYMARYPLYRRISELLGDRRAENEWAEDDVQWSDEGAH